MVKHAQTILNVFDHFGRLALKGLKAVNNVIIILYDKLNFVIGSFVKSIRLQELEVTFYAKSKTCFDTTIKRIQQKAGNKNKTS